MKKKYVVCADANVSMTTFHGDIVNASMKELVDIFGQPSMAVSEKIQFEWVFFGPNRAIITLFDWNSHEAEPKKWHVGGLKAEHTREFVKWIEKIRKSA